MSSFCPRKFREALLQTLYSIEMGDSQEGDLVPFIMEELKITRQIMQEIYRKALQILQQREALDEKIKAASQAYEFERIGSVERNILRLGLYELFFDTSIPYEIAVAETIRLARKFSTPEAGDYVNAIMEALRPTPVATQDNEHATLPT